MFSIRYGAATPAAGIAFISMREYNKISLIHLLRNMKGYIQNQTIILQESLPNILQNGDEVEIVIIPIKKQKYHFPTLKLDIKEEYLDPDNHIKNLRISR